MATNKLGQQLGLGDIGTSATGSVTNLPPESKRPYLPPRPDLKVPPYPNLRPFQAPPPSIPTGVNQQELAVLIVAGVNFYEWESVWIQHHWTDSHAQFRFTAAERDDIPKFWDKLQWRPGQTCDIWLGNAYAMRGYITMRQVAFDADNHAVELQGASFQKYSVESSVHTEDGNGNFDNMALKEICDKVLAPFGTPVVPIGEMNPRKFPECRATPGEKVWDFLEKLARVRGIILGSDHLGNFLLIGDHTFPVNDAIIEGFNLKKCQAIFDMGDWRNRYMVTAQKSAHDQSNDTDASEILGDAPGQPQVPPSFSMTPAEQPVQDKAEADERAKHEAFWSAATVITVHATVQGWFKGPPGDPNNDIWRAGDDVYFYSPMVPYDGPMKIDTVTYTQDSQRGTETEMLLVPPWGRKDHVGYDTSTPPPATGPVTPAMKLPIGSQPPAPFTAPGGTGPSGGGGF